jgi:o-succinylbenzoate synthase
VITYAALQPFALPLRRPLATARGAISERAGLLLELRSADGASAFGEAMPLAGWPGETLPAAAGWLSAALPKLLGLPASAARTRLKEGPLLARAALETALQDLAAREHGLPLAAWLAGEPAPPRTRVPVNALIEGDSPQDVDESARRALASGFRAFKLKLGARPLADDLARVAALRGAIGPRRPLRVDVNGCWSEAAAAAALEALGAFAPEYVEDPVRDVGACARLRRRSLVPIALDDAACDAERFASALRSRAADVLVLKLPLLGGPCAARAAALRAQEAGLQVVVTSFLDSAIGVAAALHCAASLPGAKLACGLATGRLFERDLARLALEEGGLHLPAGAGLGIAPDDEALRACATDARWEWRA